MKKINIIYKLFLGIGITILILVILEQTNVITFGRFTLDMDGRTTAAQLDAYSKLIISLCCVGYCFIITSLVLRAIYKSKTSTVIEDPQGKNSTLLKILLLLLKIIFVLFILFIIAISLFIVLLNSIDFSGTPI